MRVKGYRVGKPGQTTGLNSFQLHDNIAGCALDLHSRGVSLSCIKISLISLINGRPMTYLTSQGFIEACKVYNVVNRRNVS